MTRLAPSRWLLIVVVTAVGLSLWPGTSAAATCADYPNQAADQQAGDTRDADGDRGLLCCEPLPDLGENSVASANPIAVIVIERCTHSGEELAT